MNRYIVKTVLSFVAIIAFNSAGYANASTDNCNLKKIQKTDKSVKDMICDDELGNFYLKFSTGKLRTWIENPKNGIKLVLDHFLDCANPEFLGTDTHIKFVTPKIIRQGGKKFIGAVLVHRSRCNDGMGACGSGSEDYFVSIEIREHSLVKRKQFLIASCLEPYMLTGSENNPNFGVIERDEVVFNWYSFKGFEGGAIGRFNFLSNELKITERPESGCEPKLIKKPEHEKK